MIIIGGSATNGIDESLSKILSIPLVKVENKIFPDGESYIRVPSSIRDEEVLLVQTTDYPQDKHLIELFLIAETIRDLGAKKLTAIVPYLAYSRQDRRFKDGEAISIKTILHILSEVGVNTLVVVEPHKPEELSYFKGELKIVHPYHQIARKIKEIIEDPFILAPDRGALDRARKIAEEINAPYSYIEKERDRTTGEVRIKEAPNINLKGKDVVIIDDIISTGGTIVQATRLAYSLGAKSVTAAAIHLLLVGGAKERLREVGVKTLIGTNTINVNDKDIITIDVSQSIALSL
ncbi:ribose-phosphate pyrophosphokinase [Saccharolobus solfataricus]|uniref:Ribose-phosphate pyrophosphokinase n=4 Tax=Saccharolobus solfataricus TaxID=2287 RepID=KPRS_SACS2|nr:ribose-phosphate diphosphokinase [Saccharolobus solfataricus]Q97Z86.2 RecName: Full=Ribose-phosphate pyrophosphokinase; Short=RPPK; AltName: Full=5-phospho-D-ribosyl alpha-1-diphosphate synthase; AltName: Full=Phosphoribosyl diphosphate synthase; AltName: Full=Phosphoribosyl pyrophosphate synthase; Short=P-Rib-PP synthase; Short=PRPP synthase; Short=PRPPase [Saccharolobus solfataricus P2]4TWB_A Chain A, Ribose-phosphate pyrophosphokinase [Saccharolobus solfataricus]4TWB_B Chain B, Ribose-phos